MKNSRSQVSQLGMEKKIPAKFERWQILLALKLEDKDAKKAIENNYSVSIDADKKKTDITASNLIITKTKDTVPHMIKNLKSAKDMWAKLADRYLASKDPTLRANYLFNKWNKIVVFKSNQYSDLNGWMELVSNTAIELEDCDTAYKKSEKEIMNTIITGLPDIYNDQGIRRDLRRYLSEQGATLKT